MSHQPMPEIDRGACPAYESFVSWSAGHLPSEKIATLIDHVESCTACLAALEKLTAADPIGRHLRQAAPAVAEEERTQLTAIVRRARNLFAETAPTTGSNPGARGDTDLNFPSAAEGGLGQLGPYRLRRVLGQGGMGRVFEAEDLHLQRTVALKVMRASAAEKPGARERFLREARAAAAVRHPHVVLVFHVSETEGVPYLVMELLQGQSLEARCRCRPPLAFAEIVRIGRQVAEGLAAAHDKGLTHRDIKPDNIWLETPDANVKLLDFGLARAVTADAHITQNGAIVGTPAYMAPEQASGATIDSRADLFSLGCVLYRLVAGRLPFQGDSALTVLHALANETPPPLHQLEPETPRPFSQLVETLLARRPEDRPASAHAVAQALASMDLSPTGKRPRGPFSPRWLLAAALAAGLASLLAWAAVMPGASETERGDSANPAHDPALAFRHKVTDRPPIPVDALQRVAIPEDLLARAGGGDKAKAPPELVAVLGGARAFRLDGSYSHCLYTRYSSDGRYLATLEINDVLVFEVASGRLLQRFTHKQPAIWFDFRPDNRAVAVSCWTGVDFWDVTSGKSLGTLSLSVPVYGLAFTTDGKALATTDADGKGRLWDVAGNKVVRTFEPPADHHFIQAPQIHPGGSLVALLATGPKPVVHIVDLATGEKKAELPGTSSVPGTDGLNYQVTTRFSPDGRSLANVQNIDAVHLWDVATWQETAVLPGGASILAFSADRGTLLRAYVWNGSSRGGTEMRVDDLKAADRKPPIRQPVAGNMTWSDLSPDGRTVAVRSASANAVALFDLVTGKERFPLVGHRGAVNTVAVSADGRSLLSTGSDQRVLLWDLAQIANRAAVSPEEIREVLYNPGAFRAVNGAAFSPDGQWVAAMLPDLSQIHVWETATGKEVVVLRGKERPTAEFAFHPQGSSLIAAVKNRLEKSTLPAAATTPWEEGPEPALDTVAFHPDGRQVAAGDKEGGVWLWDAATGKRLREYRCEGPVLRVRFSPDGATLAATTAAPDSSVYFWDLQTGVRTGRTGHTGSVSGLAWQPNSQGVATAADDGTVRLWPRDPEQLTRTIRLVGKAAQLAFTPEGRHVVTANDDGSIYILRLAVKARP